MFGLVITFVTVLSLSLSSLTVSGDNAQKAIIACTDKGGLKELSSFSFAGSAADVSAVCKNGVTLKWIAR